MTLDLAPLYTQGYHLANLCDLSIPGVPRWEVRFHRPASHPDFLFDLLFGHGPSPESALAEALTANPRPSLRRGKFIDPELTASEQTTEPPKGLRDLLGMERKIVRRL